MTARSLAVRPLARLRAATEEKALSEFYGGYVAARQSAVRHLARHPLAGIAAVIAIARLPKVTAVLSDTVDGRALHLALSRPGPLGTPFGFTGASVLPVPADGAEYSLGADRQTLRRKARAATKAGVTWRFIESPAERLELLALANRAETEHPDEEYRNQQPDNSDLLDHELWVGAFAADGRPLLLSVTPVDGTWGLLRYFRTLGSGREFSDSRYLMTQVVVETLAARGVRYWVEGTHPAELPNGLRHFQRMVGFRLHRVVARRAPARMSAEVPAPRSEARPLAATGRGAERRLSMDAS